MKYAVTAFMMAMAVAAIVTPVHAESRERAVGMVSRQACDSETVARAHLTYNAVGNGGCIYVAGSIYNAEDPIRAQIATNVWSDETLAAFGTQD